nr:integrase, catalytic region, zinc finger, CCHC-type, peptidase aspartic, catalytic [Tanacetum cinerariifolium]
GKPTTFSNSFIRKDFSKSTSVTENNVLNDFSKPVTAQTLPTNKKPCLKNTNVLAPGMYKIHTDHTQARTSKLPQDSKKINKRVSFSIGVILTTSVSRPQLKSNLQGDRVMHNNSRGKKLEVEEHRRNIKLLKNKTSVTACNDILNAKTLNVKSVFAMCDKCVLIDKHDMCVLNSVAKPIKEIVASESNKKPRNNVRKLYERLRKIYKWSYIKFTPSGYMWKPKSPTGNVNPNLIEIVLFIVDSGCSKYMTGNLKLLINFVEKFLGTVKFRNDQIAPILGYGDLVQRAITIKRVYYVEGLNHNLFSVGQFCDADLEVAFRKSTCFIRDLKGNNKLEMSMMGELKFFLGIQIHQSPRRIFINQAKYAQEILVKHGMTSCDGIEMYKLYTDHTQDRTSKLPQDFKKTNKRVSNPTTSVSRPHLNSNPQGDRVMHNNSRGKKLEVEEHRRNVKLPKNKTSVTACNDSLNAKTLNVKSVSAMCAKCVLIDKHDMCVLKSVAKPLKKTIKFTPSGYMWKPKSPTRNVNPNVSLPLDNVSKTANVLKTKTSRWSNVSNIPLSSNSFAARRDYPIHRRLWHMTGNLKLLINFVEKFVEMVKFGNDQIAPILGYGDLVQGAITIKRVYYVEGLNHNLFSVGQFYDADLEVAFRKSTCFIRDLKGNDLLTGSRGTDLYSITLQNINSPNPICLMAKATSSQAWLWHRRLSYLNFDTINLLSKNDIVVGLPKLKFVKCHL